ncbi:RlpA-like double-psi beta-barrel domain-containing protein [Archangium violaceum]|uniref:RlpA-like double-psi beta-barrel domain-containing protein n=1 Tax=Archangium violaceum TaxID=83451 RepID=UPI001950C8E7|nr:RlpA-like double-psi beta-barrel domain-containing protein [Archangium violaceum]QRO00610.1 RlpA-like double-psi beta-barrel domain-containing protein [Archangium violaceum]
MRTLSRTALKALPVTLIILLTAAVAVAQKKNSSGSTGISIKGNGELAYYNDAGYGACGTQINAAAQELASVSHVYWTAASASKDPLCKKCARVTYNGKTITVPVKDKCPGCGPATIDLSLPAFQKLAHPDVGRAKGASWSIVDC